MSREALEVQEVASSASGASAFELRGVGVRLPTGEGERDILVDISLEIDAGDIVGIVGRSGTGKTTLLRVLGGLLAPTAGRVAVDGRPLTGPAKTVVTVFQDYARALLPWRTVARNVALPLEAAIPKAERARRVAEALELVGLEQCHRDYPWQLSGGMQQRVQIARALVTRPRVLLMDEPFGALDAITRAELQDELLELSAVTSTTVVFITHDIDEAIYLSDRVFVIAGAPGTITFDVRTGLARPRHQITTREQPEYVALRQRVAEQL